MSRDGKFRSSGYTSNGVTTAPVAATMFDGIAFMNPTAGLGTSFRGASSCVGTNSLCPGGGSNLNGFRSTVRVHHDDGLGYIGSMTVN